MRLVNYLTMAGINQTRHWFWIRGLGLDSRKEPQHLQIRHEAHPVF